MIRYYKGKGEETQGMVTGKGDYMERYQRESEQRVSSIYQITSN